MVLSKLFWFALFISVAWVAGHGLWNVRGVFARLFAGLGCLGFGEGQSWMLACSTVRRY